jgi:hypothetical protein
MILLTDFLNRAALILLITVVLFSGCASAKGKLKEAYAGEGRFLIAVYPVENLSGTPAPIKEIRESFISKLKTQGFDVLDVEALEKFMARHRVRYTGGVDKAIAKAFKEETKTQGVLIISLELYSETNPPKIALTARLVSTGDDPGILWIDGIGQGGDDSPGILGLGLIEDPKALLQKVLQSLSDSLQNTMLSKRERMDIRGGKRKFRPKIAYRSPILDSSRKYTVVVAPFFNSSERKNAGEIMVLHFIRHLQEFENFNVIEPGIIRQELLTLRIIMDEGVSLSNADALFSTTGADLILSGRVMDYQDYQGIWGKPKVDFSALLIERKRREVVWSSDSHNEGDDGVFFFDWGRVNTAYAMASQMTRSIVARMVK